MKKRANATRIGLFVVAGLVLLALLLIVVVGNGLFTRKQRVVMHFTGSIYGLQVGAPVVFRGVPVGTVAAIDVAYDKQRDVFSIPVLADLDRDAVRSLDGSRNSDDPGLALPALVKRGLRAQLAMQSLLTGQLYVDLDLRPEKVPALGGNYRGAMEIPTSATAIQNLKDQLDGMDFRRLIEDVSAIAESARALATGPELKRALADVTQITGNVKRLTDRLDRRIDPLADEAARTLAGARQGIDRLGRAADGVQQMSQQVAEASGRASALLAPDSALVRNLELSAAEVARTAAALRQSTGDDSALVRSAERTLQDVSRASRALRELAELLEQHPEAVIRGRPATP